MICSQQSYRNQLWRCRILIKNPSFYTKGAQSLVRGSDMAYTEPPGGLWQAPDIWLMDEPYNAWEALPPERFVDHPQSLCAKVFINWFANLKDLRTITYTKRKRMKSLRMMMELTVTGMWYRKLLAALDQSQWDGGGIPTTLFPRDPIHRFVNFPFLTVNTGNVLYFRFWKRSILKASAKITHQPMVWVVPQVQAVWPLTHSP